MNRRIVWDKSVFTEFLNALRFIYENSPENAEHVRIDIEKAITAILQYPERYPADKYKLNNAGQFRAFELHRFRISYFVDEQEIRIVRFRHVKQAPTAF